MGREHKNRRHSKIKIKQKRTLKLKKLRKKLSEAKFESDKEKISNKIVKIAPWLTKEGLENKKKQF